MTEQEKTTMLEMIDPIAILKNDYHKRKYEILNKVQIAESTESGYILQIVNEKNSDGKPMYTNEPTRAAALLKRCELDLSYKNLQNEIINSKMRNHEVEIEIEQREKAFRVLELFHMNKE